MVAIPLEDVVDVLAEAMLYLGNQHLKVSEMQAVLQVDLHLKVPLVALVMQVLLQKGNHLVHLLTQKQTELRRSCNDVVIKELGLADTYSEDYLML